MGDDCLIRNPCDDGGIKVQQAMATAAGDSAIWGSGILGFYLGICVSRLSRRPAASDTQLR